MAGWGTIYFGGPTSQFLQEVNVGIWRNSDCANNYGKLDRKVLDTMLCAGDNTGKDACQVSEKLNFTVCNIYTTIATFASVRPNTVCLVKSHLQFLQSYHNMSQMKVAWYVFRLKNVHSWTSSDSWYP